jgi:hypothetical protein
MSTPLEQARAIASARRFLLDLCIPGKLKRVPRAVSIEARARVKHMPMSWDIPRIAEDDLVELAGDYQAWQNDQVRLFDALALVLGMPVPEGRAFDQIDASLTAPARAHLSALAAEYQRRLLSDQFSAGDKEG